REQSISKHLDIRPETARVTGPAQPFFTDSQFHIGMGRVGVRDSGACPCYCRNHHTPSNYLHGMSQRQEPRPPVVTDPRTGLFSENRPIEKLDIPLDQFPRKTSSLVGVRTVLAR